MSDSKWMTDLRRPCTPSHPRKSAPHHRDFLGTPGSRGPASPTPRNLRFRGDPGSAVLAHPLTNGLAPVLGAGPRTPTPRNLRFRGDPGSGAPGHRISRRQSESIILSSVPLETAFAAEV